MKKIFYLLIPILSFFCIESVDARPFDDTWNTTGFTYNQYYFKKTGTLNSNKSVVFEFLKKDNSYNSAGTYTFTWFLNFDSQNSNLVCNNTQYDPDTGLQTCIGYTISTTSGRISSQFSLSAENCSTNLASSDNGIYIFNSSCQVADSTINSGIIDIIVNSNAHKNVDYTFGMAYRYGFYPKDSSQSEIKKNTDIINSNVNDIKDNLNSSDVSGANSDLNKFTENDAFKDSTGILAIIQAPINMLNSLTSTTCSPLSLPLPFLNVNLDIPCLSSIFSKYLSTELLTLLKLAINGFLVYKILCSFAMDIHNYKDPDSDRLEVIDL